MDKVVKCGMVAMGALILISLFMALTSCDAQPTQQVVPSPEEEPKPKHMQMITIEDVTIKTYSLHETGNAGGTIAKGTILSLDCYLFICVFPGTTLYIERIYLQPYIPPAWERNGRLELCALPPFTWENQHKYGSQTVEIGGCKMPRFKFDQERIG